MQNILRLLGVLVIIGLALPDLVQAQNIGGGTIDLQNGAAGSNQPSSNIGQKFVAPQASAPEPDDAAVAPPPPPPARKKKKPVARKPKAAVAPSTPN